MYFWPQTELIAQQAGIGPQAGGIWPAITTGIAGQIPAIELDFAKALHIDIEPFLHEWGSDTVGRALSIMRARWTPKEIPYPDRLLRKICTGGAIPSGRSRTADNGALEHSQYPPSVVTPDVSSDPSPQPLAGSQELGDGGPLADKDDPAEEAYYEARPRPSAADLAVICEAYKLLYYLVARVVPPPTTEDDRKWAARRLADGYPVACLIAAIYWFFHQDYQDYSLAALCRGRHDNAPHLEQFIATVKSTIAATRKRMLSNGPPNKHRGRGEMLGDLEAVWVRMDFVNGEEAYRCLRTGHGDPLFSISLDRLRDLVGTETGWRG